MEDRRLSRRRYSDVLSIWNRWIARIGRSKLSSDELDWARRRTFHEFNKFGSFHEKFVWPRLYTREIYIATRLGVRLTQKPEINHLSSPFEWLLVKPQSKSSPEDVITRALVFLPKQEVLNPGERLSAAAIIGDLKIEVFRHFPRLANVKKSRDQGLAVRFVVWRSRLYC